MPLPPDPEALLVALTLAPETYSRNRFFHLYTEGAARRVRRRAAVLRGIIRHLSAGIGVEAVEVAPTHAGGATLTYQVPALGLKRTAALDTLEFSIVRFAVERGRATAQAQAEVPSEQEPALLAAALPAALRPGPSDRPQMEAVLARLLPQEY